MEYQPTNTELRDEEIQPVCGHCGSEIEFTECWSCGGEGGRGWDDDLQFEDPLWYSPDDFIPCDECDGTGYHGICTNPHCDGDNNTN